MVDGLTLLLVSKGTAMAAFVSSVYTLIKITRGELPPILLGDNFLTVFFILACVISIMMIIGSHAFLPDNYNLDSRTFHVLRLSVLLSVCSNWLFIPISLSVIHFYCRKYTKFNIGTYVRDESDLIFILLLWTFLLLGLTHKLEFIGVMLLFPLGMMLWCLLNVNICGFSCMVLLTLKVFTGMRYPKEALDPPLPDTAVMFREIILTLLIIILMAGTTLNIISWNNDLFYVFMNPYWTVLQEYLN